MEKAREGGIRATRERWGSNWWWWTEDEETTRTNNSGFYTTSGISPRSITLPAGRAEGRFDAAKTNLNPRDPKVNSLRLITGGLRDDGRVGVVHAGESRQR